MFDSNCRRWRTGVCDARRFAKGKGQRPPNIIRRASAFFSAGELLATIYHACGIDPETIVFNHLNQPRELVKARPVSALFA